MVLCLLRLVQDWALVQVPEREQPLVCKVHGQYALVRLVPARDVQRLHRPGARLSPYQSSLHLFSCLCCGGDAGTNVGTLQRPGSRVLRHRLHLLHARLHHLNAGCGRVYLELCGCADVLLPLCFLRAICRRAHGLPVAGPQHAASSDRRHAAGACPVQYLWQLRSQSRGLRGGAPARSWELRHGEPAAEDLGGSQAGQGGRSQRMPGREGRAGAGLVRRMAGLPPPLRLLLAVELAAPHASGADL
mmetsp:Transcript_126411/g.300162  ORF Transcript_126411/g.300162 Transcript_126411/m.300162 type:complete len:246 (-) Transcript_126411:357-1094(-)